MRPIAPAALKSLLRERRELAILDAREEGEFGRAHLFWAVPCPLSRREIRARALLPRRACPVVCVDGGEGHAAALAAYLEGIGCTDVAVLEGGTPAWEAAGFALFSGVHVPSKAFGEWVEHHHGTESLDPAELDALVRSGAKHVILDSRPMDEFVRMTIPGAVNVPGGELAWRVAALAPDPDAVVVVNCAGRTRSILGAESLRQAGIPNRVVALRNGTMGWELAGFACERGATRAFPPGTPPGAAAAQGRARRFADRHGVGTVTRDAALAMLAAQDRTTYALDVRTAEEYAAGHLPGFRHAPGGQLVQATDQWVAARGARILLADGEGVRARMAGAWLRQLGGWEVLVVEDALSGPLETGPWRPEVPELRPVPEVTPAELHALGDSVRVVDLQRSIDCRAGRVPGSQWAVRGRVPPGDGRPTVFVAADDALARLAAAETPEGRVLAGGIAAWKAAGLPLVLDRHHPEDADCVDWYLRPYDRNTGQEAAMHDYLRWEVELVHGVAKDGDADFGRW